jgi:hypothetical protein
VYVDFGRDNADRFSGAGDANAHDNAGYRADYTPF